MILAGLKCGQLVTSNHLYGPRSNRIASASLRLYGKRLSYGVTVNVSELLSVPLGVVTVTYPVVAPAGTVAIISPA